MVMAGLSQATRANGLFQDDKNKVNDELFSECDDLINQITNKDKLNVLLEAEKLALMQSQEDYKNQVEHLAKSQADYKQQAEDLVQSQAEYKQLVEDMTQDQSKYKKKIHDLILERDEASADAKEQRTLKGNQQMEVATLSAKLEALQDSMNALKIENTEYTENIVELREEVSTINKQLDTVKQQNFELNSEITISAHQLRSKQLEVDRLTNEVATQEDKLNANKL